MVLRELSSSSSVDGGVAKLISGQARGDSSLVAISRIEGLIDVMWIGPDGAIGSTNHTTGSSWKKPFPLTPPKAAGAGSDIGVASRKPQWIDIFYIGEDRAVGSAFWSASVNGARWNPPFGVSKPGEASR